MPQPTPDYNQIAGQRVQRSEALADGVFAIAMTLLVLDIRVPVSEAVHSEGDLFNQLLTIGPTLLSYLLSFLTLGIFWTAHTVQYTYIAKSDRHLNWISLFYLFFVSLLPFTTAFLSEYISFKLALGLYWLHILCLGLTILIHWNYAYTNKFLDPEVADPVAVNKAIRNRIASAQIFYALAALLCFINIYLSIVVIIAIQLNYALAPRFRRRES